MYDDLSSVESYVQGDSAEEEKMNEARRLLPTQGGDYQRISLGRSFAGNGAKVTVINNSPLSFTCFSLC